MFRNFVHVHEGVPCDYRNKLSFHNFALREGLITANNVALSLTLDLLKVNGVGPFL